MTSSWLLPRLPRFVAAHPEVELNLDSSIDGHAGPWYFYLELLWGGSTLSLFLFLLPLLWFAATNRAALRPFLPFLPLSSAGPI